MVEIVSPNGAKGWAALLVALYKGLGYLTLRFLSCDTNSLCLQHPPGSLLITSVGFEGQRELK